MQAIVIHIYFIFNFFIHSNPSKKIFPEDFFGLPTSTKDIFINSKIASERKNSRITDHPKLLNPLSPKNKNKIIGINSIKEENGEESLTFRDCCENINYEEIDNKLENNNSNEERDHSTSNSSKSQISSSKSNNSTPEVCKIFNKNDNTPIQNDDLLKITPHFINENSESKNIQINLKINSSKNINKKNKFSRPLTPNLNIIKKSSAPICQNNQNKLISRINNDKGYLINEYQKTINNKDLSNKNKENAQIENQEKNVNFNINKRLSHDIIKTDTNIKKHSFSCAKNKILKNCTNLHTNSSINENNFPKKNYFNKSKPIKTTIYNSINNPNSKYKTKIPFSFNTNKNLQSKNEFNNNSNNECKLIIQRKNTSMSLRKISNTSMNKSIEKKNNIRNNSRQNKNEIIINNRLMPFKSENKINVVHYKVNNEINNLFNGLSDNIAKDPEIHNKIESLIKDIKDIQQVVQRKTQSHFRPRKQNNKKK